LAWGLHYIRAKDSIIKKGVIVPVKGKEEVIMQLILHAGSAKTYAYEALRYVNDEKYQEADSKMQLAQEEIILAHNAQTSLLQAEAAGEKLEITGLFLHAQDHLMTTMSELNLIEQIMELRKVVNTLLEDKGKS
jgi:PTS system cellobiose-specific IIA component